MSLTSYDTTGIKKRGDLYINREVWLFAKLHHQIFTIPYLKLHESTLLNSK